MIGPEKEEPDPSLGELYRTRREAYLRDVKRARETDFVKEIEIIAPKDHNTCDFCGKQDGRKFLKSSVPELPHSECDGCKCVIGCRCSVVSVVPDNFFEGPE